MILIYSNAVDLFNKIGDLAHSSQNLCTQSRFFPLLSAPKTAVTRADLHDRHDRRPRLRSRHLYGRWLWPSLGDRQALGGGRRLDPVFRPDTRHTRPERTCGRGISFLSGVGRGQTLDS